MVVRGLAAFLAVVGVATVAVATGEAAGQPTLAQREAITDGLPKYVRSIPVGCLWLDIRVSRDPRYAFVGLEFLNTTSPHTQCLRYASNGFFVLKNSGGGRWAVIYEGSEWPLCSLHIPRDLVGCRHG